MRVRYRHSDKIQDVSFLNWFYDTPNKEDYIVIDWGDLVYWQLIDKYGTINDHRIIAKDHAKRIHDNDQKRNSIRDLTSLEWEELRTKFYDSPKKHLSIKEDKEIELRSIEKELLRYISKSTDRVKRTKTFADAKGFSVSTINDVAKSLKEKYLITATAEAGLDPKTQRQYLSFRCEPTSLGDDLFGKETERTPKNVLIGSGDISPEPNPTTKRRRANNKFIKVDFKWLVTVLISSGILLLAFLNWKSNALTKQNEITNENQIKETEPDTIRINK